MMKSYFCFNRILAVVIILVAVATIFFACSKSNDANPTTDENDNKALAAASHEAQVSTLYDDLFDVALQAGQEQSLHSDARLAPHDPSTLKKLGTCYAATVDNITPGVWPKKLTIDFGTQCIGDDNRVRAGKVIMVISNYFMKAGSTINITLDGYSVNGILLKGSKVITNQSSGNGFKYSTKVTGGIIKLDSLEFGYSCDKTITQVDGAGTPSNTDDDSYSGTGTATLTYPGGAAVTYTTKEPLIKDLSCAWVGKGKAEITFNNVTAAIDYGAGICDDSVTVSIGDKIKGTILPK